MIEDVSKAEKIIKAAFIGAGLGTPESVEFENHLDRGRKNLLITVMLPERSANAKPLDIATNKKMTEVAAGAITHGTSLTAGIVGSYVGDNILLKFDGTMRDLEKASPDGVLKEARRLFEESIKQGKGGGQGLG